MTIASIRPFLKILERSDASLLKLLLLAAGHSAGHLPVRRWGHPAFGRTFPVALLTPTEGDVPREALEGLPRSTRLPRSLEPFASARDRLKRLDLSTTMAYRCSESSYLLLVWLRIEKYYHYLK